MRFKNTPSRCTKHPQSVYLKIFKSIGMGVMRASEILKTIKDINNIANPQRGAGACYNTYKNKTETLGQPSRNRRHKK